MPRKPKKKGGSEMVTCPHCKDGMRNIHKYISLDNRDLIVWHCCSCDFTLVIEKEVSVIWERNAP